MKARLALVVVALAVVAAGQAGASRWGSVKAFGFGRVDRASLDNHFVIPLYTRPTVGQAQVNLQLNYDSQFWKNLGTSWAPRDGDGWRLTPPYAVVTANEDIQYEYCGWQNSVTGQLDQWYNLVTVTYAITEPDGSLVFAEPENQYYALGGGARQRGDENTCYPIQQGPASETIPDGKGYTAVIENQGYSTASMVVYNSAGDTISDGFTDINGNQVTITNSGGQTVYADPLGTAVTESGSGTPASPLVFTYTGPGGSATVTEQFESMNITTSFGCGGLAEWSGTLTVPSEVDLPDGRKYLFGYDPNGEVNAVTLPTGATIHYAYTMDCANATGASSGLTRWESVDGSGNVWSWSRVDQSGGVEQTTETQPGTAQNQEVFTFAAPQWGQSGQLASAALYSGTASTGTELESVAMTYGYTNGYVSSESTEVTDYVNGTAGPTQNTSITADAFGNTVTESDHDWSTRGGGLLRQVTTTLETVNNVADLPTEVVVGNGSTTASDTKYGYDAVGNLQSVSRMLNASTPLTTSFTRAPNGNILTVTEPNNAVTTYTYATSAPGCADPLNHGVFPTEVQGPTGLTTAATWNCTGGVVTQTTDANGNATSFTYADGANTWRPSAIQDAAGNIAYVTYPNASTPDQSESSMTFNGGNSIEDEITVVDGLGRPIFAQRRQGPASSNYDTVETEYDTLGRVWKASQPYQTSEYPNESTGSEWTTTLYDALSRPVSVTGADGGYTDYAYTDFDVLLTRGPAPAGENTKRRQEEFDGLGRLASVCEITNAAPAAACGQTAGGTGFLTTYTRNPLGEIAQVVENAQDSGGSETRTFAFDWLGRMTAETNPESGTTSYTFDSDSTCGSSKGDLVKRVDAAGNVTCYAHDALHRVTAISYATVAPFAPTPTKTFVYDTATVDNVAMTNAKGRLAEAYTGTSKATDLGLSYDALGRPVASYEQVAGGTWYQVSESYYPNGAVASLTAPGVPKITYGLDGEGRPTTVSAASGQNPVTAAAWSDFGVSSLTLGSGDSDSYNFDPAGHMSQYKFTVSGATDTGTLTWNPIGSLGTFSIADNIPGADDNGINCGYAHDDLGRLSEAKCGAYDETFSWDAFGNHNSGGTPSGLVTDFGFSGNRISGGDYDADGNLVQDPLLAGTTNQFDAEGRPVGFWGASVTYGALGREVGATGATWGDYTLLYAPDGAKLAMMNSNGVQDAEVALPGGGVADYYHGALIYYRHADGLGSAVLTTTPSHTVLSTNHYSPFGYDLTGFGSAGYRSYTGVKQWIDASHTGGQYDFPLREYNAEQGRWWTPDPAGLAAVNPANPQTWNRYAYVGGTPLGRVDPSGLDWCNATGCHGDPEVVNVNGSYALALLLDGITGGPDGAQKPGCYVKNEDPKGGKGYFLAADFHPGERPRMEQVSWPDCVGASRTGSGGGRGVAWQTQPLPAAPTTVGPSGPVCVSVAAINSFLSGTALDGEGQDFYDAGQKYGVNPALAVAIADAESSLGSNVNDTWGRHNAWGWGNTPALHTYARGWTTWQEGIDHVTWQLSNSTYFGHRPPLDTTAEIYANWCQSGNCAEGLAKINADLGDFGVSPSSLRFQACTGDQP